VILYLGGYLMVGSHDWKEAESKFKALGFDRVYPPEVNLDDVVSDLRTDLRAKGKL
jgi:methylaspartate mutase sigma subunit